jgi:hypothetical protein
MDGMSFLRLTGAEREVFARASVRLGELRIEEMRGAP